MSIKRISAAVVQVKCISCGAITDHVLGDIKAATTSVLFPPCPACQKSKLLANVIAGPIVKTGSAGLVQSWIKALHNRLILDGYTVDGFSPDLVPADLHEGASVWPEGESVVEFVIAT